MKARWLIPLMLGAAGFLAGFLVPDQTDGTSGSHASSQRDAAHAERPRNTGVAASPPTQEERLAVLAFELRAALSQFSKPARTHALEEFFKNVSAEEMAALADRIGELPDGTRWLAMQALVERWLDLDPQVAARYVASATRDRDNLETTFANAWARRDPAAAIRWAQSFPFARQADLKRSISSAVAWQYRDTPAAGVRLLLEAGMLSSNRFEGGNLFTEWAKREPRVALACATGIENTKLRRGLVENALKGWVESDPAAAEAWSRQVSDPKLREEAVSAVAVGMAAKDLAQGLALARSLPEGRARDRTLALMADALFWNRREEAIQIIAGIPFEPGNQALKQIYELGV